MLERKLDHLADLIHRIPQPADVVVRDPDGSAARLGLGVLREELDLRLLGHLHDPARDGLLHHEPDLLEPERLLLPEELSVEVRRHSRHPGRVRPRAAAVDARGHDVTGDERAPHERPQQRAPRALQPDALLRGREHDALGGLHVRRLDLDVVPDPDARVRAEQSVEPDDVEPGVGGVRRDGDGGRLPLAGQRDDGAVPEPERGQMLGGDARDAFADVGVLGACDLEADGGLCGGVGDFGHVREGFGRSTSAPVRGSRLTERSRAAGLAAGSRVGLRQPERASGNA